MTQAVAVLRVLMPKPNRDVDIAAHRHDGCVDPSVRIVIGLRATTHSIAWI